jgi:hypothetical protein
MKYRGEYASCIIIEKLIGLSVLQLFCRLLMRPCISYIDDLTTVPYVGDDSVAWRMFCSTAFADGGTVGLETCGSFVN